MGGFLELVTDTSREQAGIVEEALFAAGALAVTLEDAADAPVLEPGPGETPLWPEVRVVGLFDGTADPVGTLRAAEAALGADAHRIRIAIREVADRVWEREWLRDFHPMRFGRRLWICPGGQEVVEAGAVVLELDPGLAFGTGTHPTTALCLDWLDGADLAGKSVLDYGCGSGILAIAAAKLGAKRVWAVDIDPQALLASDDNASENEVEDRIELFHPAELPTSLRVDVLLANILAGVLVRLAPEFGQRVKPGGRLALSGILEQHADAVQAVFSRDFAFDPPRRREDWVLLEGTRR